MKHSEFKKKFTLEQRKEECGKMLEKFPERLPIIVEAAPGCKLPAMDRKKFLVPTDIVLGQFIQIIRKRINMNQTEALFVFVANDTLCPVTSQISNIYSAHKDEDGFLYITYANENTFG
jgi:GABA(A) receptor-associated protein